MSGDALAGSEVLPGLASSGIIHSIERLAMRSLAEPGIAALAPGTLVGVRPFDAVLGAALPG